MTAYDVHLSLRVATGEHHELSDVTEALAETLADIDERDVSLVDWSLGLDAAASRVDLDMTVEADHHADAVSHAHDVVRSATTRVSSLTSAEFADFDNGISVFA